MLNLTGYTLTFDDEFNVRSISQTGAGTTWADIRSNWRFDANSDIGFGKSSFVDPASGYDPFRVADGALTITAVPDRTPYGYPGSWESGLITTKGTFSQTYGYFEMRASLSSTPGAWDAFWLLPDRPASNPLGRPGHQELDVVEHLGSNEGGVYSQIHTTDDRSAQSLQFYSSHPGLTSGYHTYGMDWRPDTIDFYFDGQYLGSRATPSDMHGPMYVLANLAMKPNADPALGSASMSIDYIRVFSDAADAVAVPLGTVSAPDGRDPGLYGATAGSLPHLIDGTEGDDVLAAGSAATVFAGDGNDRITMNGVKAAMSAVGGAGSDTITVSNTGSTYITGGQPSGVDQGGDAADRITVDGSGGIIAVFGNLGNDVVSASGLRDGTRLQIYGGRDDDTIVQSNATGTGGNSVFVAGGEGSDTISAASNGGALTIFGGVGSADSADGADLITLSGGTGTINVFANGGNDTVTIGTLGADAQATATIYGGGGSDSFAIAGQTNGAEALVVHGNDGSDTFAITRGTGQTITIADFRASEGDVLKLIGVGGAPGPIAVAAGNFQTLQQALDAAADRANAASVSQPKAAAVAFAGSTYVVIDATPTAGFHPASDQAITLTGVTDAFAAIVAV